MASKAYRFSAFAAVLSCAVGLCREAAAQTSAAPASPPPPAGQAEPARAAPPCVPACRYGYFCQQGTCVSICNPPCPPNLVCIDGMRCDYPPPATAPPHPPETYEPPPPAKKPFAKRSHSLLAFHLGFGGDVEQDTAEFDLDPTYGFNLRVDVPVANYLLLGPLFQFGAWRPDVSGPTPSRNFYFDIDFYLRGRIPIETDSVNFQLWAGVPIGLTLSFLGEEAAQTLEGFGLGWNVGLLFGGAVHFTKKFGMFAEIGWLQHKMSHEREGASGDFDFRLAQGNFNIGFVFGN